MASKLEKWNRIYQNKDNPGEPAEFLKNHAQLLPEQGVALDLASGLGANAEFLHQAGLETQAWDLSPVALSKLKQRQAGIITQVRDVEADPPTANSFDVIVVTEFLFRPICPHIVAALRPNGLLFYRTFHHDKVSKSGPSNPDYLLKNNELLTLFGDLRVLFYEEANRLGNLTCGERDRTSLIASKPELSIS